MSELHVGMRVKVVAPDPNGTAEFVGRKGVTVRKGGYMGYEWCVILDGDEADDPTYFYASELAPLVEKPGATVIEGAVSIVDGQAYIDVNDENPTVEDTYGRFVGKRVRVVISEVPDEGEGNAS